MGNPFRRRMSAGGNRNRNINSQAHNDRMRAELMTMNYQPELIDLAFENGTFSETAEIL